MPGLASVPLPVFTIAGGLQVKLGRRKPAARPKALRLSNYIKAAAGRPLPASVDYLTKAGACIRQMYLNDQLGDCVIAGKFHAAGIWSGNDKGTPIIGTDAEVRDHYRKICGPGDNGCVITEVLDYYKTTGITMGGQKRTIDGYVAVDTRNRDEVKTGLILFGGLCIGFNVPSEWVTASDHDGATWDTPKRFQSVGGHDVQIIDYNETGVRLATWGGTRTMTWRAFEDTRIVDECYAMLSNDWYNDDQLAPNGLDVATLREDLGKLDQNPLPPWEPDTPPAPPIPPAPPNPTPPAPPGTLSTFGLSLVANNWRTDKGNPIADLAGTIRLLQKANSLDEAVNQLVDAMQDEMTATAEGYAAALKIDWAAVRRDFAQLVMAFGLAYLTHDPTAVIAALLALIYDFGVFPKPPA